MRRFSQRFVLSGVACALLVAVGLAAWVLATGSSEAQTGSMHNCPPAGKWSIAVWDGASGTTAGDALAVCGPGAVDAAYALDPQTQVWSRWFRALPEASNIPPFGDIQGVLALGSATGPAATPTPAVTATATATIPAVGGFAVVKTNDYKDILDDLWVVGEVKNNNSFDAEFVKVEATLYDSADRVVASEFSYSCLDIIPAGGDSPFDVLVLDPPANIARYTVRAYDEPADEPPPSGLDISGVSTRTDQLGYYHVTGLIKNKSGDTYEFVGVCGALYNSAGKVVRTGHTYIGPDTLGPGESASFDFFESVDSAPASYRLWADGDRQ